MRKKKKKYEVLVALLVAFGVFVNLSIDTDSKSIDVSTSVIIINSDETIDGKH